MRLNRRVFLSSVAASLLPFELRAAPVADDGFHILTAAPADCRILAAPAPATTAFGFGAKVPGPLLRYKKGQEVKIRLLNKLDQPLTLSCQDMRIANAMDGVAGLTQKPVLPGESFDYRFTPPDSGFYWYRSDVLPLTFEQIDRGLYGGLIVDEADPPVVDEDMAVVLAEWHIDDKGQILVDRTDPPNPGTTPNGHYVVTVNSKPVPITAELPAGGRVRLRLLSMVQSQLVFFTFAGLQPLVVAIDGQPCEAFAPLRETIPIGPGACFDVLCDLPTQVGAQASLAWRTGEPTDRKLLIFTTRGARKPALPHRAGIAQNPALPTRIKLENSYKIDLTVDAAASRKDAKKDAAVTLPLVRHGPLTLNGSPAQTYASKPLFSVKRGTPVTLGFNNKTAVLLQMHVHGHTMRLLHDLDDGWEPYWRTRVVVPEGRSKHVAFIADNPGKWAIECQTLEQQPNLLVTWFQVT
ncbi:MAG: multicopper oxidase family protein [Methylovirgula sp.]